MKGPLNSNCEDKTEEENNLEEDYEKWKEDPWYHTEKNQDSEQHAQSKREEDSDTEKENASLTELTSSLKEKESSPIEEQDANQSSSIEPTWGQWRQKTEQELSDEWKAWEETNQGQSTQAYRHGRCQLCAKPVSTTNINPQIELTCYECRKSITENEGEENVTSKQRLKKAYKDDEEEGGADPKQGCEKTEKDDEEEWGRIPIPQSDDSDESEDWIEPDQENEGDDDSTEELKICCLFITPRDDQPKGRREKDNKKREENLAFLIGPRIDGIVRTKDGTLLTLQEDPLLTNNRAPKVHEPSIESKMNEGLPDGREGQDRNTWTSTLMMVQHRNLKMKYKIKTKKRAKLMREIRRKVNWTSPIIQALNGPNHGISTHQIKRLLSLAPEPITQFDTTQAYLIGMNQGRVLHQCVTTIHRPEEKRAKKRTVQVKVKVTIKKGRIPHITNPGTPDHDTTTTKGQQQKEQETDEDLQLYYQVANRHRPEMGESNAESVERTTALEAEYLRLKTERGRAPWTSTKDTETNRMSKDHGKTKTNTNNKHTLSPFLC